MTREFETRIVQAATIVLLIILIVTTSVLLARPTPSSSLPPLVQVRKTTFITKTDTTPAAVPTGGRFPTTTVTLTPAMLDGDIVITNGVGSGMRVTAILPSAASLSEGISVKIRVATSAIRNIVAIYDGVSDSALSSLFLGVASTENLLSDGPGVVLDTCELTVVALAGVKTWQAIGGSNDFDDGNP